MRLLTSLLVLGNFAALASVGCSPIESNIGSGPTGTTDTIPDGPTRQVTQTEEVPADLQQTIASAKSMDGAALQTAYPPPKTTPPQYDATTAKGMELIQASSLALNANELAGLGANGLVISTRKEFPSFPYGYKSIYAEDLPLYVSADSILEAVHRTFDSLLKQNEELVLIGELSTMLSGMRSRLTTSQLDDGVTADADLYLTMAESLLSGKLLDPALSANKSNLTALYQLASSETGHSEVKLFGVTRDEDFSQFAPRGHYADTDQLKRYFKAMMWLGRVDLRLIETQSNGEQVFYRRQFDAAVALRELLGTSEFALWQHIDDTIGAYVGEHDSMTPKDLDGLLAALNVSGVAEAAALMDQQIIDEIARGGWGAQRIASRIIYKDPSATGTLPLDRSFLLFGQRYTVDSHTFVNVTSDRVAGRMMPKPLDVAFAALGNNAALPLLAGEFPNQSYVAGLAKTRALVDAHEPAYWDGSIYTHWLSALRSLSPNESSVMPSIAKTDAWQNRMLSTQLASWSELRHDTILYAKQSYTAGSLCEFPDAYVDPYPEFYAKLGTLAEAVNVLAQKLPATATTLKADALTWVRNFQAVTTNLQKMAEDQQTGTPHSAELMAFINDAVKWDESTMCGGVSRTNLAGWYLKLFLTPWASFEFDPVVADVHTQPTDEAGNDVGRILHVGTGRPRLMVVTTETCEGPRAYAGLAFSYG
ncbi:MAG TPA: DUF3160 domain-containing protein, partial [Polyangiaceae bacterium]